MDISQVFKKEAVALERDTAAQWELLLDESLNILGRRPDDGRAAATAERSLRKLGRVEEAQSILRSQAEHAPSVETYERYINLLAECNLTEQAIIAAQEGLRLFPDSVLLKFKEGLTLPVIYRSPDEIKEYRRRFTRSLKTISKHIALETKSDRAEALAALAGHTNHFLAYQGQNDRQLQALYGSLAHRIMAANYPRWSKPLAMPVKHSGLPIKVGYVSSRFRDVSSIHYFLGWLRGHDRARFEVHAWHVDHHFEQVTEEVRHLCSTFHHSDSLEDICWSIRQKEPQVLIFLDVGLDPLMTQLAALRLAPVQCMAWDHPVTSGLPTMDYALTGDLTELSRGDAHYSEQLVRLPGVGVCFRRPLIPAPILFRTRRDFGLGEERPVFLCCQSLFKFLPQNDWIFPAIARQVPNAQFVFIKLNNAVGNDFLKRLDQAFLQTGLRAADYCVMLTRLSRLDYWNLNLVADVFLDTIGWSSGVSVFDAIACKLPVVTIPGSSMRSRQAHGILNQLGVPEMIAGSDQEYVDLAVKLAVRKDWREEMKRREVNGYTSLYDDGRSVRALEEFIENLVRARSLTDGTSDQK